jgi:hypothetical protein
MVFDGQLEELGRLLPATWSPGLAARSRSQTVPSGALGLGTNAPVTEEHKESASKEKTKVI